ncbi:FtsX-like permease family protein [Dactylosporangium sp. NPDC051541]|uniref:FtsX-like permease family protein n=1 Tax=Dactylosporangium sp. NPDC051541 TaxID=3363977 RepID=UPI003796AE10
MSAVWASIRAGVRRRRLQSAVVAAVTLLSTGTAVLGLGLLVVSDAPFDHAFKDQSGAHVTAQFDPAVTGTAALATTATTKGVRAGAGPFETVSAEISAGRRHLVGELLVAGRQEQQGAVDRLTLDSGHWLTGAGQIVLGRSGDGPPWDAFTSIGGTVTLTAGDSKVDLTVVGIAYSVTGTAGAWVWPTQSDVLRPAGEPHTGLEMLYRFDSAADTAAVNASLAAVTATLPEKALSGSSSYLSSKQEAGRHTAPLVPFVLAFAVLGLVMAALVVANVVSGAVIAGYQTIGIRKTLGFTPGQVVSMYAGQMFIPGVVGSACGVLLGNLLALPLLAQASRAYNASGQSSIPVWVDLAALAGVAAILAVAAAVPAVRAGRLPAMQAISMGRAPRTGRGFRVRRWLAATGLPRPVSFGLGTPLSRPGRSAGTVVAILLGAVTMVFAVGLTSSLSRVSQAISRTDAVPVAVPIPHVRDIGNPNGTPDLTKLESAIKAQAGTAHYVAGGNFDATVIGAKDQVRVNWYAGDATWTGLTMVTGRWYQGAGEAIAASALLRTTGHHVGDTITVSAEGGQRSLTVVGEYFGDADAGLVVDSSALTGLTTRIEPQEYDIALKPGTSIDAYIQGLDAASGGLRATNRVQDESEDGFVLLYSLIATLTLVLTAVAALGVFNTVVLNVRERVHEIGVLKTVGMTPRQVRAMVVASMVGLGVVAGMIAVPLGVSVHGWIMPAVGNAANTTLPASITDVYDGGTLALLGGVGIVIAVLGALVPAGWAARSRIATALRAE